MCALLALLLTVAQPAPAAEPTPAAHTGISPLAASEYSVQPVCGPVSRGARCLSLRVVPKNHARVHAKAAGTEGLTPNDLHSAYAKEDIAPEGDPQTIAIVAAFDDPTAVKDLKVYSKAIQPRQLHRGQTLLRKDQPARRTHGGEGGQRRLGGRDLTRYRGRPRDLRGLSHPPRRGGIREELSDLEAAENEAAEKGATEISNSFVFPEPATDSPAFDHKGIVITAASGDEGFLNWTGEEEEEGHANYPASSPHVVAVSSARLDGSPGEWSEEIWNGRRPHGGPGAAGSGCSARFTAPYWQLELPDWSALNCHSKRAVADISADADPLTDM